MKISRSLPKKVRIEIIPMIDTMFFLLLFFMVATLTMTNQNNLPVNLPHGTGVKSQTPQVLTVTLTKDDQLFYEKESSSPTTVVERLTEQYKQNKETSVIINADRRVEHGRVIELMEAIRQSGIVKIGIAVNPN
ncbi:ExbD/TolR family protein [Pelosinus sp. sgz500959]|uniref:ExbD/TolR family protein n=1 Tax=Pelosinus sp. sgz500959 TaxID=3242472 RepID=UPI00366EA2FC